MPVDERGLSRWITALLLAASALIGVAHIALLPPWEGFDETAHWSYVQELADTGHAPRPNQDRLSADITAYSGPLSSWEDRPTYLQWRLRGAPTVVGGPTRFSGSGGLNWQAQHPPLYYLALTPLYRLAHGLGWIDHLIVLRLMSFAMAWAGLAFGVVGTARLTRVDGPWTAPIMAAWPFFFPQFFPQFARLGNDSLCLLEASIVWVLLLRLLEEKGGWISAATLGLTLGLGLLTKAFFLPIGAGVLAILAWQWIIDGRRIAGLGRFTVTAVVALALGGGWYLSQAAHSGSLIGADEFSRFNHAGGLASLAHGVSPLSLLWNLAVIPATFVWAGTWSLARPHYLLLLPLFAFLALAIHDYARGLKGAGLAAWAPIALAAPLLAGLAYHALIAVTGHAAETPGWYMHILAAPLGYAVARGWRRPLAMGLLVAYGAVFTLTLWIDQLALFSGCATKGPDKHYAFNQGCLIAPNVLEALGHPGLGAIALILGTGLAVAAAALVIGRSSLYRAASGAISQP